MPWTPSNNAAQKRGLKEGYRSGLEDKLADQLTVAGLKVLYEVLRVDYEVPARTARYTPDLLLDNGIIIEGKGRFVSDDRAKHRLVKAQHPDLDIRFVFSRSAQTISKTSKTTYGDWCVHYGFQFADKLIPTAWLKEPFDERRMAAARRWLKK